MNPEPPLSKSTLVFKSHVNSLSTSIAALLKILETVDKVHDLTEGLTEDLETFHYSLTLLTYHVLADSHRYEDWCDVARLSALLKSAEGCFSRLQTLLLNGTRSEFYSVKKYLQASRLDGEMKHLRLRLTIYITALSNPILLTAVHVVHLTLGASFRKLAFKTINDWIDQLTKDSIKLARDEAIQKPKDTTPKRFSVRLSDDKDVQSDLYQQREDLIKILQAMIGTAMKMVKRSQRDIQAQQIERSAIEIGDTTEYRPATPVSVPLPQPPPAPAPPPATTLERTSTSGSYLDPNEIAAFQQLAFRRISSRETPEPSSSLPLTPLAANLAGHSTSIIDTYTPSNIAIEIQHLYTNAQSLLIIGNHNEALDTLETTLVLSTELPPSSYVPPNTPSRTDILFLISTACLNIDPKRITRARHALREIYITRSIEPIERRYEAAHMLAQLYMFVDGNVDDPTVSWDDPGMNLGKAKEYIIAAVQGRKRLFGNLNPDTQKSVELLTTLCERVGTSDESVLKELLEVLRGTFSSAGEECGDEVDEVVFRGR